MSHGWKVIIHLVVNFNIWAAFRLFYRIFVRILHHAPRLSPNGGCTKIEWKNKAFCFIEHEPTRDYSELKKNNYNYCTINTFTWLGNFYLWHRVCVSEQERDRVRAESRCEWEKGEETVWGGALLNSTLFESLITHGASVNGERTVELVCLFRKQIREKILNALSHRHLMMTKHFAQAQLLYLHLKRLFGLRSSCVFLGTETRTISSQFPE